MAKKKTKHRMECGRCRKIMSNMGPCCDEHTEALAKESFNFCTVCNNYFPTKKELCEHSH